MHYVGTLFMTYFPYSFEEQRIINGVEQPCLVIPCLPGQMQRTRYGGWFVRIVCNICPPNPAQRVLDINLSLRNMAGMTNAIIRNSNDGHKHLGHIFVDGENDERVLDKTNNMTHLYCEGRLFIDSIAREDVKIDPYSGRKYIDFTFRKSRLLDAFGNSHEIVVKTDYGEHQIGVARQIDIEEAPESPDYATKRDERTVEQRCAVAGDKAAKAPIKNEQKTEPTKENKKPSVYDSFEW